MKTFFRNYLAQLNQTAQGLDLSIINAIADELYTAIQNRRHVFVLGNGGSAAAATHWVCDFNKGVGLPTGVYPRFISLADQLALFTALGNDLSYDQVFSEQLRALMEAGDVVLILSVSGNSGNLLKAAEYARENGGRVISILGDYNGKAAALSDLTLTIPSRNYGVVEDLHMSLDHMIAQCLTERMKNGHE